jgi:hypothetical protein
MKAIINGKRFNSDTAIKIGEGGSHWNVSRTDFSFWEATLYRTPRSGAYFLAGKGGPMTRWAKSAGNNSYTGSSGILPLARAEALEWAEKYLSPEEIEHGFSEVLEDA